MAANVNKVVFDGRTIIDLTADTVRPDSLIIGMTAHDSSGAVITGTNPYKKAETDNTVQTQADLLAQIIAELDSANRTAIVGKAIVGYSTVADAGAVAVVDDGEPVSMGNTLLDANTITLEQVLEKVKAITRK